MVTWRQRGRRGGRVVEELRALPGKVVVVEDGGPPGEDSGHHVRGRAVERQRAQVLDDHQVGAARAPPSTLAGSVGPSAPMASPGSGRRPVRRRPRERGEAELAEGPLPLGRLDGHAVGAAEAEGEEGGGRDGVTVAAGWPPLGATAGAVRGTVGACPTPTSTDRIPTDDLLAERRGPVLTLTINRPERRNAMTWEVIAGLRASSWPGPRSTPRSGWSS